MAASLGFFIADIGGKQENINEVSMDDNQYFTLKHGVAAIAAALSLSIALPPVDRAGRR